MIIDRLLEKLKETISEKLAKCIEIEFTSDSMQTEWDKLYRYWGSGSDYWRRTGIIDTMKSILPNQEIYLANPHIENIVDKVENIFIESIKQLEEFLRTQ